MAPLVTLISGCSSGIGLTTAVKMAKDGGYIVYATMRNLAKKEALQSAAGSTLDKTLFIRQLDITKEESIVAIVKQIREKHGRLDILVNNAAFSWIGAIEDMTMKHMRDMSETNIIGTYRMIQEVIPMMKQKRSGRIVNISSLGGISAYPFGAMYIATKFALEGFTESLYPELRCFNVKISNICPGPVSTSLQENMASNQDPEAKQSNAGTTTNKLLAQFVGVVNDIVAKDTQQTDEVADVIIGCIKAEDPALRYATDETGSKYIRDRFVGGIGDAAAKNWATMLQNFKST